MYIKVSKKIVTSLQFSKKSIKSRAEHVTTFSKKCYKAKKSLQVTEKVLQKSVTNLLQKNFL